ncbi:MAG: hypothetical protein OHK0029_16000 [Armatimonadaceae bacterium]
MKTLPEAVVPEENFVESAESKNGKNGSLSLDPPDVEVLNRRLHYLIDRKFLQLLTANEAEELSELLAWRDQHKSEFYRSLSPSPASSEQEP